MTDDFLELKVRVSLQAPFSHEILRREGEIVLSMALGKAGALGLCFFAIMLPSTAIHAALEEKSWRSLPEEFQVGYLWGILDATMGQSLTHKPEGSTELYWYGKEAMENHLEGCIKAKKLSPMELRQMLDEYLLRHPEDSKEPIYAITRHLIFMTCSLR